MITFLALSIFLESTDVSIYKFSLAQLQIIIPLSFHKRKRRFVYRTNFC